MTASEINYDEFREKVASTIDTEDCFIKKPVENQKLLDVVNELMNRNIKTTTTRKEFHLH